MLPFHRLVIDVALDGGDAPGVGLRRCPIHNTAANPPLDNDQMPAYSAVTVCGSALISPGLDFFISCC